MRGITITMPEDLARKIPGMSAEADTSESRFVRLLWFHDSKAPWKLALPILSGIGNLTAIP